MAWVFVVFILKKKRCRSLKAVVPVQVQVVAVSHFTSVLLIRRALKHWGLLLIFRSDAVSSREKEQRKTHRASLFSYYLAFSNNA